MGRNLCRTESGSVFGMLTRRLPILSVQNGMCLRLRKWRNTWRDWLVSGKPRGFSGTVRRTECLYRCKLSEHGQRGYDQQLALSAEPHFQKRRRSFVLYKSTIRKHVPRPLAGSAFNRRIRHECRRNCDIGRRFYDAFAGHQPDLRVFSASRVLNGSSTNQPVGR